MTRDESTAKILFKTVLFTLLAPGGVTLGIPYLLLISPLNIPAMRFDAVVFRWLAGTLIFIGAINYAWCTADFVLKGRGSPNPYAPPTRLVVSGFYRYMHNPIYVGLLTSISSGGI